MISQNPQFSCLKSQASLVTILTHVTLGAQRTEVNCHIFLTTFKPFKGLTHDF